MTTFGAYSKYYDLIYKNKNYASEANYVDSAIRDYVTNPESMLELGCGTGRFSKEFAKLGYRVHGVDLSEGMIEEAKKSQTKDLSFSCDDVRTLSLERKYDVVTALFHVLSYQSSNQDVLDMLATIKKHLSPNGITLFDFWYGPAVLMQQPRVRFKEMRNDEIALARVATPCVHFDENIVDVNYTIFIRDLSTEKVEELQETHRMRYFFAQELAMFYDLSGMMLLREEEWMTGRKAGPETWGVMNVLRHK